MNETKFTNELTNKMQKSVMLDQLMVGSHEFNEIMKIIGLDGSEYTKLVLEYLLTKILFLEKRIRDLEK